MNVDCTTVSLIAAQATNNLAIILCILVFLIAASLYSCFYLSGTISQSEEQHDPTGANHAIID